MDGLVVAEVGLAVKVVVVIEIMEWSTVDQEANRRMWMTLSVSRVHAPMTC
jgi:hypothetical protein